MAAPAVTPLYCLHFLGGSARSWSTVASAMSPAVACIALDLPGFGEASHEPGATVAAMAEVVATHIRADAPARWWLAGHSMGAKVALALARRAEDGEDGLSGLAGIALLAGSPPAAEPMSDEKRADLLDWIDQPNGERQQAARTYIRDNVSAPLEQAAEDHAVANVLRANPEAWKAWLTEGSREDLRDAVGKLAMPALILSGKDDSALGPDAQQRLMVPHLSHHRHIALDGTGHLLPLECPGVVAVHLRDAITLPGFF